MELNKAFHGKAPNDEELKQALEEIKKAGIEKIGMKTGAEAGVDIL